MSDLKEFVNQQKAKNSFFGTTTTAAATFSSLGTLRSKITSSINGFSLLRTSADEDLDREKLTQSADHQNGQLPSSRNRKNGGFFSSVSSDDSIFGMSRMQRIVAFFMSLAAAFVCFGMALLILPAIVIQARKFAALNTLGSIMLILSFAFLWGPMNYLKHMFSAQRRHVTAAYLTTVITTLYFSLWLRSTLITILCASFQAIALLWYILSYAPGGERGLRFLAGLLKGFCISKSTTVLPI